MPRRFTIIRWAQLAVVAAVLIVGVAHFQYQVRGQSLAGRLALQRLDLFYLNQPAPFRDELQLKSEKTVLVFCGSCDLPDLRSVPNVLTRRSNDPRIAASYGLLSPYDRVGPGYALVDSRGQVRYRTFDSQPALHAREIRILVRNLP